MVGSDQDSVQSNHVSNTTNTNFNAHLHQMNNLHTKSSRGVQDIISDVTRELNAIAISHNNIMGFIDELRANSGPEIKKTRLSLIKTNESDKPAVQNSPFKRFFGKTHKEQKSLISKLSLKKNTPIKHIDLVTDLKFQDFENNLFLVSASIDSRVYVYNFTRRSSEFYYSGHEGAVNCIAINPKTHMCLSASGDGTAHIWPIEDLAFLSRGESDLASNLNQDYNLKTPHYKTDDKNTIPIISCDWFKKSCYSSNLMCTSGHSNGQTKVYDFEQNDLCIWHSKNFVMEPIFKVVAPAFDNCPYDLFSVSSSRITAIDLRQENHATNPFPHLDKTIKDATLISENEILVASSDKSLRIFDIRSGASPKTFNKISKIPNKVCYLSERDLFVVTSFDKIRVLDENFRQVANFYLRDRMLTTSDCHIFANKIHVGAASTDSIVSIGEIIY